MIILLILFVSAIYLANIYSFNYWKRRNILQFEDTKFLFGNGFRLFIGRESIGELFQRLYNKAKGHKIIGAYLSYRPVLMINDPDLIKDIMIKNFAIFHDRPVPVIEDVDPLTANLFFRKGKKWRDLRVKLSPCLTSGKLKNMFPIMMDCGKVLLSYIDRKIIFKEDVFEFRDLMARFTTNIISSVAFGVDNDCINEPGNIFRQMGMKIFDTGFVQSMKNVIVFLSPDFFAKLKITLFHKDISDFMISLIQQTIQHRENNEISRNDFMQLMIELKNEGFVSADKTIDNDDMEWKDNFEDDEKEERLTINDVAAQVFLFFIAGFETSSSTIQMCLYELCKNQEIQKKLQEEIDEVLEKVSIEEITYDTLQNMKYLSCCIDETLRKYPIVTILFRVASKDFQIPDTNHVIEKGTAVYIPILGIHRDPDIYEDPLAFKPDRFQNSSVGSPKCTSGITYSPFGDGPRKCIGDRMGKIQAKLGVFLIMSKYSLAFNDASMGKKELTFYPHLFTLTPVEKFNFKVTARK